LALLRLIKYILYDILRNRFILFYTLFLFLSTYAMFQLDSDTSKVILSMLNIVLMVVPLVSIIFTTIHFYNSYEFIEMMLAQPINRNTIFLSQYIAVSVSMSLGFFIGTGTPMLIYGIPDAGYALLLSGFMLTMVFVSMAFLASVITRDKAKAIGMALLFWFYFVLIYDALLLWIVYTFSDYPLEKPVLALIAANPVDLARVMLLLKLDISALMGFTGAFYRDFFGSSFGMYFALSVLVIWVILPLWLSLRIFRKKDL
jgi:Cu-processing system permease protein